MSYREEGSLTTDKRTVDESTSWDSTDEWDEYEDISGLVIEGGKIILDEEATLPESGLLHHYDFSQASGSGTVEDLEGDADLTGSYAGITEEINGVDAGYFNGSQNLQAPFSDISQPYSVYVVFTLLSGEDDGSNNHIVASENSKQDWGLRKDGQDDWRMEAGGSLKAGGGDTDDHLWRGYYDGSDSTFTFEGNEVASGDAGGNSMDGLTVGSAGDDSNYSEIRVGEIAIYDPDDSGYTEEDIENYLADKWGFDL